MPLKISDGHDYKSNKVKSNNVKKCFFEQSNLEITNQMQYILGCHYWFDFIPFIQFDLILFVFFGLVPITIFEFQIKRKLENL